MNPISFIMVSLLGFFMSDTRNTATDKESLNNEDLEFDEYGNPVCKKIHSEAYIEASGDK